jgi:hypothetical protein
METKTAFKGPTLGSLLEAPAALVTILQQHDPAQWMFHTFRNAWDWCEALTEADKQYLAGVISFVRDLPEAVTIISSKINPEDQELFYRSCSYAMFMYGLFNQVTFNSDYTVLKRIPYLPEIAIEIPAGELVEENEAINS